MQITRPSWGVDHERLLSRLQEALAMADSLEMPQVAIHVDMARVILTDCRPNDAIID